MYPCVFVSVWSVWLLVSMSVCVYVCLVYCMYPRVSVYAWSTACIHVCLCPPGVSDCVRIAVSVFIWLVCMRLLVYVHVCLACPTDWFFSNTRDISRHVLWQHNVMNRSCYVTNGLPLHRVAAQTHPLKCLTPCLAERGCPARKSCPNAQFHWNFRGDLRRLCIRERGGWVYKGEGWVGAWERRVGA